LLSGGTDGIGGVTMTTNANDLDPTADRPETFEEAENGSYLREATRQALSNGLDMTTLCRRHVWR